ncbi:type I secretion system permease/ATPase [Pseudoteredinibacter isoporae]|uniref:ATP-binding cassette subfamily C protein LapB n=1 Tax=Pseudoteredinibacter isoporae TaxID=570281 RepID=A0A7X0MVU5_9GAMM|nr:type I secretion system permease/ATPase [Pseudoteredinibacter isoporae]MBB6521490.1 ATP-binding cassette subfamily C protein LapB [Pseudoteredinibacter isoporae]NHO87044.1 type I secretion system permease/ATPase [Pseudoteredinibacter isoporae]NIB24503.1 type I secretion system permease/ATPase [Pseudoteredinibacter isoporae]
MEQASSQTEIQELGEGPAESASFCDPLLESLLIIARIEHLPISETSLTAGLPLINERLTPKLFIRSAERAGLSAKVIERPLDQISALVLPAVLLLENNDACVLTKLDAQSGKAEVLDPHSNGKNVVDLSVLQERYSGYSIFCKPLHRYDERTQEIKVRQKGHWFWGVLGRSWRIYRDVLLASLFINLFAIANPLFVMNVYDRVVPNEAVETLWVLAIGVATVYFFDLVLKLLRGYFIEVAGKKSDVLLSAMIFERVLGARLEDKPMSVGSFASQLKDFESVRSFITSSTVTAFVDLPFTILFLLVIFYVGGPLVLVPLACIPIVIGYALFILKPLRQSVEETMQSSAQKNSTLVEALASLETVKGLGAEGRVQRAWEKSVGHLAYWGQKSRLLSNSAVTVAGTVVQLSSVAVIVAGVYLIAEKELTMGALIACVMLTSRALAPLSQLSSLLVNFEQTVTALESLETIVDKAQERDEEKTFIKRPSFSGEVRFNKVSFAYPGEEHPSIETVSFTIKPRERVAIIGRMGSGKTTVQKLMMGLFQPTAGSVLIDGIDIQQLDPADLRHGVGYVPQDVSLFFGSVKDNIAYGTPHATDQQIVRAAEHSGVTGFVNKHPMGFQRPVGERGAFLSGGQRQSIGVARALIKDPSIYLLDEPSTGMDNSTEAKLKQNLMQVTQGKTVILVTHKTSLLDLVDRIIVLENGKLIADGSKESVLDALKKGQIRVEQ